MNTTELYNTIINSHTELFSKCFVKKASTLIFPLENWHIEEWSYLAIASFRSIGKPGIENKMKKPTNQPNFNSTGSHGHMTEFICGVTNSTDNFCFLPQDQCRSGFHHTNSVSLTAVVTVTYCCDKNEIQFQIKVCHYPAKNLNWRGINMKPNRQPSFTKSWITSPLNSLLLLLQSHVLIS